MLLARLALLFVAVLLPVGAQTESQRSVTEYLVRQARVITDAAAPETASREAWERVRARRLEEMRSMLGLLPWPARTPLRVRVTGKLDQGDYFIEKIAFESLPKFYVTANLYVPKRISGRVPAVVYVCGHAGSPFGAKTQYQRHGISFAKNGYVAFILDPIQIAEIFAPHHGVSSEEMYDWYSRGYTPAGVETWNAMRAIDYLETRPEVDRARIGMTGRSGGAAMSWFTACVDPRVKVVAPVMGISTYAANVRENTQARHCDCMFPINFFRHDMIHQGALIAPRPLLYAEGRQDALFPVAGYTEFDEKVRTLYTSYGRAGLLKLVEVDTGHQDSDFLREQVLRWFDAHFLDDANRKLDMAYTDARPESLAVFPDGPPADARNARIHEEFTTRRPSGRFTTLAAWERRRAELMAALRDRVFGAITEGGGGEKPDSAAVRILARGSGKAAVLYVASDGEDVAAISALLSGLQTPGNFRRAVVFPRGVGEVPWNKTFWKGTLRNAMHVGETVDSMRLKDVLAAVNVLGADSVAVMGKGVSAGLALYAAILDARIGHVVLIDPPSSHTEAPIFLNVLRYTDLPEAAALVAPRRITFYARSPAAYDYTRHIYALYGKSGNIATALPVRWTP